ncbi:MAG: SAM-dependent chlorinase/fluorinase [Bacteroidota bacterium]|nr:SAM-dependent chlorinase/fluorinase [Bacteroidota bacterium]
MTIITLTTDIGIKDFYLPAVKGFIYSQIPDAQIIDISHVISPFNVSEASFILRNCYLDFPPGSIHLISVDSDTTKNEDYIIVKNKGQYIIGKNNGIISLITDEKSDEVIKINNLLESDFLFPLKNILAKTACKIAKKTALKKLGSTSDFKLLSTLSPIIEKNIIRGTIIYIDNFGNAITNVSKSHFERFDKNLKPKVLISNKFTMDKISKLYSDVSEGQILAIFGSSGLLEIAMNKGNASKLVGLTIQNKFFIDFK